MTDSIRHLHVKSLNAGWKSSKHWISKNVNFEVAAGEILAIMGPSGSGKSTLIKALQGVVPYRSGKVFVNGHDESQQGLKAFSTRVAFVPQDDVLVDELTVVENIRYYHNIAVDSDLSGGEVDKRIRGTLQELGIAKVADSRIGSFGLEGGERISGGQRKRANIAMELVNDPDILIIDEPTSGLSSHDSLALVENLRNIAGKGKIVIIIIHQPSSDIFKLFDRLMVLDRRGNCVRSGKASEVMGWFEQNAAFEGKSACDSCGNVFPEKLLGAVEARENWDSASQAFDAEFPDAPAIEPMPVARNVWRSPWDWSLDVWALIKRQLLIKRRDKMSQLFTLAVPPLLGLLLASVFKATPQGAEYAFVSNTLYPQAFFMLIIGAMFLGMVSSVFEVIKDRPILGREVARGLAPFSYYLSEVLTLALIGAVQTVLLVVTASWALDAMALFWTNSVIIYFVMLVSMMTGLLLSTLFKSQIAAYNLIPLILIPQIILGGALLAYKDMGEEIYLFEERDVARRPMVAKLMPASWAYQMGMRTNYRVMRDQPDIANIAVMELEYLKQDSFLSPQPDHVFNETVKKHLPQWSWVEAADANDRVVMGLTLVFLASSGFIWIRRDYGAAKAGLWALQGALVIAMPIAHAQLMTRLEAPPKPVSGVDYFVAKRPMAWQEAQDFCASRQSIMAGIDQTLGLYHMDPDLKAGTYWTSETESEKKRKLVWTLQLAEKTPDIPAPKIRQVMLQNESLTKSKRLMKKQQFVCSKLPR